MNGYALLHIGPDHLVLDKPAGLLAVPGRGPAKADSLAARVQAAYPDARVVHRLDQATSGLMLMARGIESQRALGRLFESRQIAKRYVAVVAGVPATDADGRFRIDLPLAADWPRRPLQRVDHEHGRAALTLGQLLASEGGQSRVELEPLTGRAHQLRVHLLAIGHPILGDALYAPPAVLARAERLLLHATGLAFVDPRTGATCRYESPPTF